MLSICRAPDVTCSHAARHCYQVAEKDGFIWLYFGNNSLPEDERPPIPTAPQQLEGSWLAPSFGEVALDLGHFPVFENAIDMAHM